jgi:N-acetyl-anhydromuramyl-L-alanine amidase AmpD
VDRNGTIFRLTPETMLDRHAIGYNWCAIGIENVGGVKSREDLTREQLQANVSLIKYLQEKYPTIRYVWGHYQQTTAKASGLYRENVSGYFHGKVDPGPKFMKGLQKRLKDTGLLFFKP